MFTLADYEKYAQENLSPDLRDYLNKGSSQEVTLNANREAFNRYRIRPRYLRNVSQRSLETTILGQCVKMPIGIAPSGLHTRWHGNGELATVKGCHQAESFMIVSAGSSVLLEDIAAASPSTVKWFQLFIYRHREMTHDMIRRAEASGYKAIVITVDAPGAIKGHRVHNIVNKYKDPAVRVNYVKYNSFKDVAWDATWDDIAYLKNVTNLPIVVKGILTAEDARLAIEAGVSGVFVSNHGGRQLDSIPGTLEVLSEIVEEVNNEVEVFFDGGVRCGTDVFKALALGARAVFVGRPVCWGLVHSGSDGVRNVLDILKNELDHTLALSGCSAINDINSSMVKKL